MIISNIKIGTSYFFTPLQEFAKENIRYLFLCLICGYFKSKNWNILFFLPPYRNLRKEIYVTFDTLADSVRATAQNHDLLRVRGSGRFVLAVVGAGVVLVLHAAHRHGTPAFDHAEFGTLLAHVLFADAEDLGDVLVAEAVLLGLDEISFGRSPRTWVGLYSGGNRLR